MLHNYYINNAYDILALLSQIKIIKQQKIYNLNKYSIQYIQQLKQKEVYIAV